MISRRSFHKRLATAGGMTILPWRAESLFAEPLGTERFNVPAPKITPEEMNAVYEEVKTPYKYGIVLPMEDGDLVDSGKVFRKNGVWYLSYLRMLDGTGYVSRLAQSDDLIHWEPLGTTMPFRQTGWDAWQASPSPALVDTAWGGGCEIRPHDGKYWFSYIGGAGKGYEPDPLAIGLAWTEDPTTGRPFVRLPKPIMTPYDADARPFEKKTLYQTAIIKVDPKQYGYPFYCFYNGKDENGIERIGIAVSDDLYRWQRFGPGPVVDHGSGISGDPQVVRMGDYWVMFYFGAWWKPQAFDTFAVSKDLIHWTVWDGPLLIKPSEDYDSVFAHKPWVLKQDGVVYHFYCAVNKTERTLALATSRKI